MTMVVKGQWDVVLVLVLVLVLMTIKKMRVLNASDEI
jgi:hypothetical protein